MKIMAVREFVVFVLASLVLECNCGALPTNEMVLKLPESCMDQIFCSEKPKGYDHLEKKINSVLPEFLQNNYADHPDPPSKQTVLSPQEDWHNCPYENKTQSIYLYNHGGKNTKIDIIVQTKLFRQYVNIVTCASQHIQQDSDEQCFQELRLSAFHMKSSCENSMARRPLYVFDPETSTVFPKTFEIPACCQCKVSFKI